jgi:hypothetical protein
MKLAPNASRQAVGAFLMGYGVITPCRQRPIAPSDCNSRALVSQSLPKVIARPEDGFRVLGLGLTWRLIQVQKSLKVVRVSCNTRTSSRGRDDLQT